MKVQGRVKVSKKTKTLVDSLLAGDIAVIRHDDIDELAAAALSRTGIRTIINTGRSMTGNFISLGTRILFEQGIKVIDVSIPIESFKDKDLVTVINKDIIIRNKLYKGVCTVVNPEYIRSRTCEARLNEASQISGFIENTILYAKEDIEKIICFSEFPRLNTGLKGRHVLVAARNIDSEEEIKALRSYILKCNPVFIGVDGGADILLNCGYTPDILIGDMDSVSDIGLLRSRELVLHSYPDGYCPCLDRVSRFNLAYSTISMIGTSEDAALMLSYRNNAELIVLAGGHSCMYDFISKGRAGMGSTFITRTIVGDKLVDCKGISRIIAADNDGMELLWAKM